MTKQKAKMVYLVKSQTKFCVLAVAGLAWIYYKGNLYLSSTIAGVICGGVLGAIKLIIYSRMARKGVFILPMNTIRAIITVCPIVILFIASAIIMPGGNLSFLLALLLVASLVIVSGLYYLQRRYGGTFCLFIGANSGR